MLKIKRTLKNYRFYGSSSSKATYDWRDDPSKNVMYEPQLENYLVDPRKIKLPFRAPLMKFRELPQFSEPNNPNKAFNPDKIYRTT